MDLFQPVDVVGRGAGIGRFGHQFVDFGLCIVIAHLVAVDSHPVDEAVMVDDIFLEGVAGFVDVCHLHVRVAGVHLAAALVNWHEHGFDT